MFVQDVMDSGQKVAGCDAEKLLQLLYKDVGMCVDKSKLNIVYLAWDGFENKND